MSATKALPTVEQAGNPGHEEIEVDHYFCDCPGQELALCGTSLDLALGPWLDKNQKCVVCLDLDDSGDYICPKCGE